MNANETTRILFTNIHTHTHIGLNIYLFVSSDYIQIFHANHVFLDFIRILWCTKNCTNHLLDYVRPLTTTYSSWSRDRKLSVVHDPLHIRHFHSHLCLKFATWEHLADIGHIVRTYCRRQICWAPAYTNRSPSFIG